MWKEKVEKARQMIRDLCKPRGSVGAREWMMSIPAQPDRDPDLVIAAGLSAAERRIAEIESWTVLCCRCKSLIVLGHARALGTGTYECEDGCNQKDLDTA